MTWKGKSLKSVGRGPKIAVEAFYGTNPYVPGGTVYTMPNISNINHAIVEAFWEANPTLKVEPVVMKVSGTDVIVVFYWDMGTPGPSPFVEVSPGTDLSGVRLTIVAFGE